MKGIFSDQALRDKIIELSHAGHITSQAATELLLVPPAVFIKCDDYARVMSIAKNNSSGHHGRGEFFYCEQHDRTCERAPTPNGGPFVPRSRCATR